MHLICIFFNSNVVNYVIVSRKQQFYFVFMWEPLTQFSDWTYASAEPPVLCSGAVQNQSCSHSWGHKLAVTRSGSVFTLSQEQHWILSPKSCFSSSYISTMWQSYSCFQGKKKKKNQKQKQIAVVFWLNFWTLLASLISRFVQCPCCNFVSFRAWL